MKISIDATPLLHGSRAARRHSKNLIDTLLRLDEANDYTVFYINWRNGKKIFNNSTHGGVIKEHRISIPGQLLVPMWRHFAIPRAEWMMGESDILYATNLYFPPVKRGIVLGTVRGVAYRVIQDKLISTEATELDRGLKFTLRHADYLLAVSFKTREELIERFGVSEDRIFVVPHGVDTRFCQVADRGQLVSRLSEQFKISSPYILYVGVIGHHKNIMGILKAYSLIRERGLSLSLVLAGPPGSAWLEAQEWIAREGLNQDIHLLGPIDQSATDLRDLYNGASLFVFPSFYEGWTAPPVEAMACGVPVVTSNVSSIPETVGDAAIQVDPHNIDELSYQMERVLTDTSLRKELIEKGLTRAASQTWEKTGLKLLQVFQEIQHKGQWKRRKW